MLMFLNLSEEVQGEDRLRAMDLVTGLTGVVSELKALGTNFAKQNILASGFGYCLELWMDSSEPVTHNLALGCGGTLQM